MARAKAREGENRCPVIDLETGETLYETGALPWRVWASFSPDGRRLAISGGDQIVRIWNPETRNEVTRLPVRGSLVRFSAAGAQLVVISQEGKLSVLNGTPTQAVTCMKTSLHTLSSSCGV